jgi:cell division protein ZipA
MSELRLLILVFGLLLIVIIYLSGKRKSKISKESSNPNRIEPIVDGKNENVNLDVQSDNASNFAIDRDSFKKNKIVTVRIIPIERKVFHGDVLIQSFKDNGLRYGKFDIFHRYQENNSDEIIFSVANSKEPGTFDIKNIKEEEIFGITLFLNLPVAIDNVEAFDQMMNTARILSGSLNADLLDESGSTLSIQRERYIREEIIEYQHGAITD